MIRISLILFVVMFLFGCSQDKENTVKTEKTTTEAKKSVNTVAKPTVEDMLTKIRAITPSGKDVPAAKEIVFQFSDEVVPLGKMDRKTDDINIKITPTLACEWRWLSRSALACRLSTKEKLNAATEYSIQVPKKISKVDAFALEEKIQHSFSTVVPKVISAEQVLWLEPGVPYYKLHFNMPVKKSSLLDKVYYIYGEGDRMALSVLKRTTHVIENTTKIEYTVDNSADDSSSAIWYVRPKKSLGVYNRVYITLDAGLLSPLGKLGGKANEIEFDTFPEFEYLGIECSKDKITNKCDPLGSVGIMFSSPVRLATLKKALSISPSLHSGLKDFDPWANHSDYSHLSHSYWENKKYTIWLPRTLKAFTDYKMALKKDLLVDEFGRKLARDVKETISIDHRRANLNMPHTNVVLEKNVDSAIPVYATNLDDITIDYVKLVAKNVSKRGSSQVALQDVQDLSYKTKLGLRKLLGGKSGALYGQVYTSSIQSRYKRDIFAQVTPFQVHAKLGHFNSLIWVTDFKNAQPVKNAKVTLMSGYYNNLGQMIALPYKGKTNSKGLVKLVGTQEIDKKLQNLGWVPRQDEHFFVKVEKGRDIALLPLDNNFKIYSSGTYSSMQSYGGHTKAWGTTAQGVYKLGDKVEYKIYVRGQNNKGLISPNKEDFTLRVYDPLNKLVYEEMGFSLNKYGSAHGSFKIPKEGAVGEYRFSLVHFEIAGSEAIDYSWAPLSILVSDFTPASFGVKTEVNGESFKVGDKVEVTTNANLYSGGPYTEAESRLTAHLFEKRFSSNHVLAKGFNFGDSYSREYELFNIKEKLDAKGEANKKFELKDVGIAYGELFFESSVKDERGKYISSSTKAMFSQRDRFIGLKETKWVYSKNEESTVEVLVVNELGKPVAGTEVNVDVQYKEYKASRVKGPGNAFVTVNTSKWITESSCKILSSEDVSECLFTPKHVGSYKFIATHKNEKDEISTSTLNTWVSGPGAIVWDQSNDSTLQIIPQNNVLKVGEIAKYLVKNPFPGAKALVSVERYGVLHSWVQTLETGTPIIWLTIKPEYIPGFYLSVTVISPRVAKSLGDGIVDLGKPSYKMGYVKTIVKDAHKELALKITTDKKTYKPKEKVSIDIHVDSMMKKKYAKYELAVVVIDESVLALNKKGENSYDPYSGFNSLDRLDVTNFSLLSRLIGRQKFEKKGANQGGDGGATTALTSFRDDFKYIAYWNPSLETDSKGNAKVKFTLPDNLTGWKVLVMAVDKNELMGLGNTSFKTSKPTEVRSNIPNQVLKGDSFSAGFNVMNRTDKLRDIKVLIELEGVDKKVKSQEFNLTLEPFKRENVYMPVNATDDGVLTFKVKAEDKYGSDSIVSKLSVHKRTSLETMANFGSTTEDSLIEEIQVPKEIVADVGEVGVILSTSVIGNIDGAFKYLKEYPYWCWEQRLTKAVGAEHYNKLQEYMPESFTWDDSKSLTQRMINDSSSFQAPNGGMAFWKGSNEYVSPYLSAYTALEFGWLKENGYKIPSNVENKLHSYLKNILSKNNLPSHYSDEMSSTVRAVALNALTKSGVIDENEVSRYFRHYKNMSLFGKAHYLESMINVKDIDAQMKNEVLDSILSHSVQSAGKYQFNEEFSDGASYLLATPMRTNCAILSTIVSAQGDKDIQDKIKNIAPKLVRTITQTRGNKDHWENTQENGFCMKALVDYAKVYEAEEVSMNVEVKYDKKSIGEVAFKSKKDANAEIFTPLTKEDIGKKTTLDITKKGQGRLYYTSRISYAPSDEVASRVNSGIEVRREYSIEKDGKFEILKTPMQIKQGDIVRVDLFISLPTQGHFVVLNDPIPGGLEPINSQLATTSVIDAKKGDFKAAEDSWWFNFSSWSSYGRYNWSFYHKELRNDSARFYSDYLPAGNYHLSYTAQAIAEGTFSVMPSHVEEMYDPDVYGKSLPAKLVIKK